MIIKEVKIDEQLLKFEEGLLGVLLHSPDCKIPSLFVKGLNILLDSTVQALKRKTPGTFEVLFTLQKRQSEDENNSVNSANRSTDALVIKVNLKDRKNVMINGNQCLVKDLQEDLDNEKMIYFVDNQITNVLNVEKILKYPSLTTSEAFKKLYEFLLYYELSEQHDFYMTSSRDLCLWMMRGVNIDTKLQEMVEDFTTQEENSEIYRTEEQNKHLLTVMFYKSRIASLKAEILQNKDQQAFEKRSMSNAVRKLQNNLDDVDKKSEKNYFQRMFVEKQSIELLNLCCYMLNVQMELQTDVNELEMAQVQLADHEQTRIRLEHELDEITSTFRPGIEQSFEETLAIINNMLTLESQLYYKQQAKYFAVLIAEQAQDRDELLQYFRKQLEDKVEYRQRLELNKNSIEHEMSAVEANIEGHKTRLAEHRQVQIQEFFRLLQEKKQFFGLQQRYVENVLKHSNLDEQATQLSTTIDDGKAQLEEKWKIESHVLEGVACVELFIRSLEEGDDLRAKYLGPLLNKVELIDENIFGIVYEEIRHILPAYLFETSTAAAKASISFATFMKERKALNAHTNHFSYTFLSLASLVANDDKDAVVLPEVRNLSDFISDDCQIKEIQLFKKILLVDEGTVVDEVIDEWSQAGYCVIVMGDGFVYSKNNGFIIARLPLNLSLSDFQNDLSAVMDRMLSLMVLTTEKKLTADAIVNLDIELEELSRIAAEKPCLPQLKYSYSDKYDELVVYYKRKFDVSSKICMVICEIEECNKLLTALTAGTIDIHNLDSEIDTLNEQLQQSRTFEMLANNSLKTAYHDFEGKLENVRVVEQTLNTNSDIYKYIYVTGDVLAEMIETHAVQLRFLNQNFSKAQRWINRFEEKSCDGKEIIDLLENDAWAIRQAIQVVQSHVRPKSQIIKSQLAELRTLTSQQKIVGKMVKGNRPPLNVDASNIDEIVLAAAATQRKLATLLPPLSTIDMKRISNHLHVVAEMQEACAIEPNNINQKILPYYEKVTMKSVAVVFKQLETLIKHITGEPFALSWLVKGQVSTSMRMPDIQSISMSPNFDQKLIKLVFFLCLLRQSKCSFVLIENIDKIVPPHLLAKVFDILKPLATMMQIIVTIQSNKCPGYIKRAAQPCNCWTVIESQTDDTTDMSVNPPSVGQDTPEMPGVSFSSSGSATPDNSSKLSASRCKGSKQRTISLDTIEEDE